MKLELPKRKAKQAATAPAKQAGRPGVQPPAFLNDLYRDMRDRRLIWPALALLILIVAVPIALAPSSTPEPTAAPPLIDENASAVVPAVLAAEDVAVRDFRERLDALQRKNPFSDKFAPKVPGVGGDTVPSGGGGAGESGSPVVPVEASPAPDPSPSDVGSSAPDTTSPVPATDPEVLILAPRINVAVGVVGKDKRTIENVKTGDLLPDKDVPIAMFLGASEDLASAKFVVSRDIIGTNGDGRCRPAKNDCQFLDLEDGQTQYFRYGPNGKRYSIRVTDIREVVVDKRDVQGD